MQGKRLKSLQADCQWQPNTGRLNELGKLGCDGHVPLQATAVHLLNRQPTQWVHNYLLAQSLVHTSEARDSGAWSFIHHLFEEDCKAKVASSLTILKGDTESATVKSHCLTRV